MIEIGKLVINNVEEKRRTRLTMLSELVATMKESIGEGKEFDLDSKIALAKLVNDVGTIELLQDTSLSIQQKLVSLIQQMDICKQGIVLGEGVLKEVWWETVVIADGMVLYTRDPDIRKYLVGFVEQNDLALTNEAVLTYNVLAGVKADPPVIMIPTQFDDPMSWRSPIVNLGIKVDTEGVALEMKRVSRYSEKLERFAECCKLPARSTYDNSRLQKQRLKTQIDALRTDIGKHKYIMDKSVNLIIAEEGLLKQVVWIVSDAHGVPMVKSEFCQKLVRLQALFENVSDDGDMPVLHLGDDVVLSVFIPGLEVESKPMFVMRFPPEWTRSSATKWLDIRGVLWEDEDKHQQKKR